MNRGTRRTAASVLCATAALVLAACGGPPGAAGSGGTGSSTEPLVIGMSLPLSGPAADRAGPGYEGYQYWADELNATGGLLGRPVELSVLDDGFDQETAISNYNRLIAQDRVDLVLGTFSSVLNLAVAPVAERNRYVYIEPSGGADEIFQRNFSYLFFAQPATTQGLPDQLVDLIGSMPPGDRPATMALIQQDDPNTVQAAELYQQRLEPLGLRVVYEATYPPDTSNFDAIANSVKEAAPELVIQGDVTGDGIALTRALQRIGFSPRMLHQQAAPTDPTFASAIGEANTEGVLTSIAHSVQSAYPGNAEFVRGYTERFGNPPSEDAANSYTAGQVLAAAVTAVGRLDQQAMKDWLHANTVDTIVGPLRWDAAGRPQGRMLLAQYQGGKLAVIAPREAATATFVPEKPAWR